jgi:hypothetical protein
MTRSNIFTMRGVNQLDHGEGISGKQVFAELDTECDSLKQPQSTE